MPNQQTVDIFKLIRDSPSAIAMQEPIDTMPSDAWKSCCAYRFFFPQPQNLISPQTSGSAQQRPSNCKIIFNHSPWIFEGILEDYTTYLAISTTPLRASSPASHHPGLPLHTSQAKTKLAKNVWKWRQKAA
ncbi:hypothetical protein D6C79_09206 [Aureobasidium pullulans]|nr:hypothetical protein D6C79_09206 [Aureobasidium pullulans]